MTSGPIPAPGAPSPTRSAPGATREAASPVVTAEPVPAGDRWARPRRAIFYLLLIGYSILMLVPFAWSVSASFKTQAQAQSGDLTLIPDPISLEGWQNAFTALDGVS